MNPRRWKFLLIGAVVAVAMSSTALQADAHWWGYYRPWAYGYGYGYGCYSCYTPTYTTVGCCNTCYDGSWYLGWRPGPVRRLLFGRYKWYWGGYCNGCCTDGCVTCQGCTDGSTAVPNAPTPATAPTPAQKPTEGTPNAPAPTEPAVPSEPTSGTSAADSGILTVWVPYDAKVTVNGLETKSVGSRRQFVSYGLKAGFSYKYEVKAQIVRDGQVQEDTRVINLTAGQTTAVAFGFNKSAEQVAAR